MNLLDNPFHILGATTADDRRRIQDLADERALAGDAAEGITLPSGRVLVADVVEVAVALST